MCCASKRSSSGAGGLELKAEPCVITQEMGLCSNPGLAGQGTFCPHLAEADLMGASMAL